MEQIFAFSLGVLVVLIGYSVYNTRLIQKQYSNTLNTLDEIQNNITQHNNYVDGIVNEQNAKLIEINDRLSENTYQTVTELNSAIHKLESRMKGINENLNQKRDSISLISRDMSDVKKRLTTLGQDPSLINRY